jgi:glycosyltransferase involved in cell wall biosynthesis
MILFVFRVLFGDVPMTPKSPFYEALEHIFPHLNKVCVVTSCFPPCPESSTGLSIGGISKKYEKIAEEFRYRKKRLCTISLYYENVSKDQDGPDIRRIGVYYPYTTSHLSNLYPLLEFFNPLIFLRCLKVLVRERPDLVIIGETYQMSLAPIFAAKVLGIGVIIQHDWFCPLTPKGQACDFLERVKNCGECLVESRLHKQQDRIKVLFGVFSAFMFLIKRSVWNRCLVFAEGRYFRSFYVESGIRSERVLIVPPSPTVTALTDHDQEFMSNLESLLRNAIVIVYVGRLSREKGVELLLESYRILKNKVKCNTRLVLAGNGQLRDLVVREARNDPTVLFLDWLPKEKLKCVYLLADVVVIPSILPEAYPHVALEALSLGKRVIGFRMGGLLEIANKNHLVTLVENADPVTLAEAIIRHARIIEEGDACES